MNELCVRYALLAGALVAVAACGSDAGGDDDDDGSGGDSVSSGSGAGSANSKLTCCINDVGYACPNEAALDQCGGFDIDGCMQGCGFDDFACQDACFMQWETSTPDPSACTESASVDCGQSSGAGAASPGPNCSDVGKLCDYDDDCCSSNCSGGECHSNSDGASCDYDDDCSSSNCVSGTCYGNSAGNPCDYDDDCNSNNCAGGTCQ